MRVAAVAGAVMVVLMWGVSLPPQGDVFMDNHIIYALVLLGRGRWWTQTALARRFPRLT